MTMNNPGSINCPVHGTHGSTSNGKCWYCVQTGNKSASDVRIIRSSEASTARVSGTKRIIT